MEQEEGAWIPTKYIRLSAMTQTQFIIHSQVTATAVVNLTTGEGGAAHCVRLGNSSDLNQVDTGTSHLSQNHHLYPDLLREQLPLARGRCQ